VTTSLQIGEGPLFFLFYTLPIEDVVAEKCKYILKVALEIHKKIQEDKIIPPKLHLLFVKWMNSIRSYLYTINNSQLTTLDMLIHFISNRVDSDLKVDTTVLPPKRKKYRFDYSQKGKQTQLQQFIRTSNQDVVGGLLHEICHRIEFH